METIKKENIKDLCCHGAREQYYKELGYTEDAKSDDHSEIRLEAHKALGWTKEALTDEDEYIRLMAYDKFGYTDAALDDEDDEIRCNAYIELGYTEEAFNEFGIEMAADEYFTKCMELLELNEPVYEFTETQAIFLRLNGIKVNPRAIKEVK